MESNVRLYFDEQHYVKQFEKMNTNGEKFK